jgi:hypothetical protein
VVSCHICAASSVTTTTTPLLFAVMTATTMPPIVMPLIVTAAMMPATRKMTTLAAGMIPSLQVAHRAATSNGAWTTPAWSAPTGSQTLSPLITSTPVMRQAASCASGTRQMGASSKCAASVVGSATRWGLPAPLPTHLGSAGQNGLHTWRHCAERPGQDGRPLLDRYPVLPEDLRALLHHTSGQARIERFLPTAPGHAALLPRLSHYDGRLMYAASMSGLGVGPVTHDNLPDFAPYRPAWYRVRFTVPRDWRHPGVLGVQVPGIRRTWEWPAEPGHTGET